MIWAAPVFESAKPVSAGGLERGIRGWEPRPLIRVKRTHDWMLTTMAAIGRIMKRSGERTLDVMASTQGKLSRASATARHLPKAIVEGRAPAARLRCHRILQLCNFISSQVTSQVFSYRKQHRSNTHVRRRWM